MQLTHSYMKVPSFNSKNTYKFKIITEKNAFIIFLMIRNTFRNQQTLNRI